MTSNANLEYTINVWTIDRALFSDGRDAIITEVCTERTGVPSALAAWLIESDVVESSNWPVETATRHSWLTRRQYVETDTHQYETEVSAHCGNMPEDLWVALMRTVAGANV
jgi:hypothetical protein